MKSTGNPIKGVQYFLKGLRLIFSPELRKYIILPIIINLVLFLLVIAGMAWVLFHYFSSWLSDYPHWVLLIIGWLLGILYFLVMVFVGVFTFTLSTNIIASPFYGYLSEKTEKMIVGETQDLPFSMLRILKRELIKILYFIPLLLLCGILFLIPPLWPFLPFLIFLPLAWFVAIQYIDYCPDNQGIPFKVFIKKVKSEQFLTVMGFGSIVSLCISIPILNLFIPPAAVVGGVLLWLDTSKEKSE